jgi:hypothetical protein
LSAPTHGPKASTIIPSGAVVSKNDKQYMHLCPEYYRKISIYFNFHAISKNSNSLKSGRTENSKGQRSVNDEYEYEFITITKHVREVEYIFPEKDDYTPENVEQKKGMLFVTK